MPIFRCSPDRAPAWCEVESFDNVHLGAFEIVTLTRRSVSDRIVVASGFCELIERETIIKLGQGGQYQIDREGFPYEIRSLSEPAIIVRFSGHWGDTTGSCGVFELRNSTTPQNDGDPVLYPRGTCFDNHYHDCDEYWLIIDGRCVAISEGRAFLLEPGDCLVTGMGHHHDIPVVIDPILGVYFEGTMEGRKRAGHLWEHRDGPAQPVLLRI